MFALPSAFLEKVKSAYRDRPVVSNTGRTLVFSFPRLSQSLEAFVRDGLKDVDDELYEIFAHKLHFKNKGYGKDSLYNLFKPANSSRDLVDLICLYVHGENYDNCVTSGWLPDNLIEFYNLKTQRPSWKGKDISITLTEKEEFHELSPLLEIEKDDPHRHLKELVLQADQVEFSAYKALPEIHLEDLREILDPTGTAYKRIYAVLKGSKEKSWIITNENNPSGFTVYNCWTERVAEQYAILKSHEYWYLKWFDTHKNKYVYIYNEENVQTWALKKINDKWIVESTYYPPPANLSIWTLFKRLVKRMVRPLIKR